MAKIKANLSARKNRKRRLINKIHKSTLKNQIKKTKIELTVQSLDKAYKTIDSKLSKGVITKNKAARLKSRTAIFINKNREIGEKKV